MIHPALDGSETVSPPAATPITALLGELARLDQMLEHAVAAADAAYGPEAASDPFRGLHAGSQDAARLLARQPGVPPFGAGVAAGATQSRDAHGLLPQWQWLAGGFGLCPFDLDVLLVALAPDVDLRYERLYGYLQDDVTKKRPSVDLALNLLCPSAEDKVARRMHFSAGAPLLRHGLLRLIPDPHQAQPPLLSHFLKLDDQAVDALLGVGGLDRRLARWCDVLGPAMPDVVPLDDTAMDGLHGMVDRAIEARTPLRMYFEGPVGSGRRHVAKAIAARVGLPLLVGDLVRAPSGAEELEGAAKLVLREAAAFGAVLYVDGLDSLDGDRTRRLLDLLATAETGIAILAGTEPWVPPRRGPIGVVAVRFGIPSTARRRRYWVTALDASGIGVDPLALEVLAGRFRLTPGQIENAVATASWRAVGSCTPADLFSTARQQTGHEMATLAGKVEPVATWDDIVLPDDAVAQLREICARVVRHQRVLDEWGFARKLSRGKGANALFAGSSGTGKTMAAEVIAGELGLDLYKIDLAGVVSKYIGETEKNLDRIFTAAENANAILLFDEAEALFGKRSEVRDSHDRYANIEISYLLHKMEEYEGLAILATNLRQNLDEAFLRRLASTVHFPFPDEASRLRIWEGMWPTTTPRAADLDLGFLARELKLSGGNIKNVALAAAFLAADSGEAVSMDHVLHAVRREYQKMGKVVSEETSLVGSEP